MKIGFITTIDTNIGDDFIRLGIENIINSLTDNCNIQYTYINKHRPETAILSSSPIHFLNKLPKFRGKHYLYKAYDKYLYHLYSVYKKQDLIIQSGAPVLWPNCYTNEWAKPVWYNTIGKLKDKIPVVNLAAGSCYPWEQQSGFSNNKEKVYAQDIGSFCKVTTTRDKLANFLFSSAGVNNYLLPCTAFFVDDSFENKNEGKYILINYMEGGGHFSWDQNIDNKAWKDTLLLILTALKGKYEVRFICHSEKEVEMIKHIAPSYICHFPKSVKEYIEVIKYAIVGLNNRMHASVAMASVGVPSISVCTDTRLLMLENIGLPIFYVKEAKPSVVLAELEYLVENVQHERERLFKLKELKFKEYQTIIKDFVK